MENGLEPASMSASAHATAYTSKSPTDAAHEPLWGLPTRFALRVTEFLKSHCVYRAHKSYVHTVSNTRLGGVY